MDISPKHTFRKLFIFFTTFCWAVKDLLLTWLCFLVSSSLDTRNKYRISIPEIWMQCYQGFTSTSTLLKSYFQHSMQPKEERLGINIVFKMLHTALTGKQQYQRLQNYILQLNLSWNHGWMPTCKELIEGYFNNQVSKQR